MNTIHELRKAGFKVRVLHFRKVEQPKFGYTDRVLIPHTPTVNTAFFLPKGGKTRVELRSPDGKEVFGEAICADVDSYNRKKGVAVALGRAKSALMKNVNIPF